jgi:hypothetical protein
VFQQELEGEMIENAKISISTTLSNESTEATSCRALELVDTVSEPCGLAWELFYATPFNILGQCDYVAHLISLFSF